MDKKGCSTISKTNKQRILFMMQSNVKPIKFTKTIRPTKTVKTSEYKEQTYKGEFQDTNKFKMILFSKCTHVDDEETWEKMMSIQKVRFLYRNDSEVDEIFALPSGSGRNVIMKWTDSSFPLSVASAILDVKSATEKEVKNLFDNRYLSSYKMIKGEKLSKTSEFYLRFAPQVYTKFHANINDANLDFKRILGYSNEAEVKVQIKMDSIMFPNAVNDMNKYSELCEKISAVHCNTKLPR